MSPGHMSATSMGLTTRNRRRVQPVLQDLEGRRLLSGGLTEFPIPQDEFPPYRLWDGSLSPGTSVANGKLTVGPDGRVWFEVHVPDAMGSLTVLGVLWPGSATPERVGGTDSIFVQAGLTTAPDGSLWYSAPNVSDYLAHITLSYPPTTYTLPFHWVGQSGPDVAGVGAVVYGPDNNIWFLDAGGTIDRMTPDGHLTQFMPPHPGVPLIEAGSLAHESRSLIVGPDGALWFTEPSAHQVGRITSDGTFTEFALPEPSAVPGALASLDGAVWFTEQGKAMVGRMATDGTVTELTTPSDLGDPTALAGSPDGTLVLETDSGQFARVAAGGTVTALPLPRGVPNGLAVGPNGAIWFADPTTGSLARFEPDGALDGSGAPLSGQAGQPLSQSLATFTAPAADASAGALTATINWGDGHSSTGTITTDSAGLSTVHGTNTYAQGGTFVVQIRIVDTQNGQVLLTQSTATIAPVPQSQGGPPAGSTVVVVVTPPSTGSGTATSPNSPGSPGGAPTTAGGGAQTPSSGPQPVVVSPTSTATGVVPAQSGSSDSAQHHPHGLRALLVERFLVRADRRLHQFRMRHPHYRPSSIR